MTDAGKVKKILYSLFFFFIAGLCEIGGGYLVWLWLREDMSSGIWCHRWVCLVFIWYSTLSPTFLFSQNIHSLWRRLYCNGSVMGHAL